MTHNPHAPLRGYLWDCCVARNSLFSAAHRGKSGGGVPHGLASGHGVYWNTRGGGGDGGSQCLIKTQQVPQGYVIGTQGGRGGEGKCFCQMMMTAPWPENHIEGEGMGATLSPVSLFEDQLGRRRPGKIKL